MTLTLHEDGEPDFLTLVIDCDEVKRGVTTGSSRDRIASVGKELLDLILERPSLFVSCHLIPPPPGAQILRFRLDQVSPVSPSQ